MGDERTYDYTIALRAVETTDFMTGVWSKIPYEILEKVSSRIVNEVPSGASKVGLPQVNPDWQANSRRVATGM